MVRTYNSADANIATDPPNVILLAANTATFAFQSEQNSGKEIAFRKIQHCGASGSANVYFSINTVKNVAPILPNQPNVLPACDNVQTFHGYISPGQQADFSTDKQYVSVFCTSATPIATIIGRRNDSTHQSGEVPANNP